MERIQVGRAKELQHLGELHRQRGGELYLATLTVPHRFGDRLESLLRRVPDVWRRIQAGRAWVELKSRIGFSWSVRALETTVGPNGWHPHLHVLIATGAPLSAGQEAELLTHIRERWAGEMRRLNWPLPSTCHGVTLARAHRDTYVTKLVAELVRGGRKQGRAPEQDADSALHRTPLELLEDVANYSKASDVDLWREYARAMHGRSQLTWGGSLRTKAARAAAGVEDQTDLELAGADDRGLAEVIAEIPADLWDTVVADNVPLQLELFHAVEELPTQDARDRVQRLLDRARGLSPPPF